MKSKLDKALIVVIVILAIALILAFVGFAKDVSKHRSDTKDLAKIAYDALELAKTGIASTQWCMDKLDTAISYRDGSVTLFLHEVKLSKEYEKVKEFLKDEDEN